MNPKVKYYGTIPRLEFRGSCLKQDRSTFNHGKIVNIYIVYELDKIYLKSLPTLLLVVQNLLNLKQNILILLQLHYV